jgi:hypothetical protein
MACQGGHMKHSYKIVILVTLIISSMTAGCSGVHTLYHAYSPKPIYPELRDTDKYPIVDSLQPELKWKDIRDEEGQTYDLCIWSPTSDGPGLRILTRSWSESWGIPIYYVQNLTVNYHNVEKQLMPDTQYNWSVRLRKGEEVFRWAGFSQTEQILDTTRYVKNIPYGFTTPRDIMPGSNTHDTITSNLDTSAATLDTPSISGSRTTQSANPTFIMMP